jgi:2-C-methyl-D-erythritol 2,4-cyclodiphosphate synthase
MRVGTGFDLHRLVAGRKLILGGVDVPFETGLEGHSDGDALTHAIIDALLGAAGLGDIGLWFPPGDPKFKDASSIAMLQKVIEAISKKNLRIGNIDATIICQRPKLSALFDQMKERLALALDISIDQINIKATTTEGLGAIGQGQAIAAQAAVLLFPL